MPRKAHQVNNIREIFAASESVLPFCSLPSYYSCFCLWDHAALSVREARARRYFRCHQASVSCLLGSWPPPCCCRLFAVELKKKKLLTPLFLEKWGYRIPRKSVQRPKTRATTGNWGKTNVELRADFEFPGQSLVSLKFTLGAILYNILQSSISAIVLIELCGNSIGRRCVPAVRVPAASPICRLFGW